MNKRIIYITICFFCLTNLFCIDKSSKNMKSSLYELKLYFNPISSYSERSINQIRNGAYESSLVRKLTKKQVKSLLKKINKRKQRVDDFELSNGLSYTDFLINKNAHSFGEILDSNNNIIIIFTFDELESEYMIINDELYKKNQPIYNFIRDDVVLLLKQHNDKLNEIKDNARNSIF